MKVIIQIGTCLGVKGGCIKNSIRSTEINWGCLEQIGTWVLLDKICFMRLYGLYELSHFRLIFRTPLTDI